MANEKQSKYISDLAVAKTKEFKEVKELLKANEIIGADATIVDNAQTIAEITGALTDMQASKLIDALIATKAPERGTAYSKKRIDSVTTLLDDIKKDIDAWDFPSATTAPDYGALANSLAPKVLKAVGILNNPEIDPDTRQRNQEILLREVAKSIYEKTYEMNAFDMQIAHTKGPGIDDRYYGMAKVASNSVSTGAA
ncbi:hypothetical protein [Polynucleobacter sp.]|uniref:hypothetical protein n=1 Tax=Polynucleobacter sp. TaxID=2029855 RepID=UPI003F69A3BF